MTFKEYFKLTKETSLSVFKYFTIIFSITYTAIAIFIVYKNQLLTSPIKTFILIFVIGNSIALFVWFLAITSAFREAKKATRFFDVIPEEIKEYYKLRLIDNPLNPKYNYLTFKFLNKNSNEPFRFNFSSEFVWITIFNDFSEEENLSMHIVNINQKYKNEKIDLSAWGLRKKIKWKDWDKITIDKINQILDRLTNISNDEDLKITNVSFTKNLEQISF